ncbi:MAG: ATP-dependent DNA helicase RecG [Bacteroidia bacterium]
MNAYLQTPIEYLKGVGPAKAELLKKDLEIFTFHDLIFHFPYRHIDRSRIYKVKEIDAGLAYIQLKGTIGNLRTIGEGRASRLVAEFYDGTGVLELVWFQGVKWVKENLKANKTYLIFGKPSEFNGSFNMVHPTLDEPEDLQNKKYLHIMPLYTCTEKMKARGIDSKAIMKMVHSVMADPRFELAENIPSQILSKYQFLSRVEAFKQVHFPDHLDSLGKAEHRLKFEELFFIQLRLLRYKMKRTQVINGIRLEQIGEYFNTFYNSYLPFELTNAQKRVLKEIRADVKRGVQMNRLLQGDVGSGKTVVALMCMLMALDNNYQACMMAPTEILAQQHYQTLVSLLKDMPVKVALLTGSTKTKERKQIALDLESGALHILVGTHALIEDKVVFKNLGMAIVDEQHRFGVEQRARLWKKNNYPPHVLVMTATPIPRTLAMTLYGDLDTSIIDELPAGRKPIQTLHRFDASRLQVYGFIKQQIQLGRQVYIVYPLIEESEKLTYKSLVDGFESIIKEFTAPKYAVSMVHGKLKATDKDFEMQRFVRGETQIMVATTVIEVGVNVPNASVMIIESAEKFGLSQLHQLRGRVGRGADQSYCILMSGHELSNDARLRLKTMTETTDGFKIAEVDLKLRGPGELEGTAQSGSLDLKIADISADHVLIEQARNEAKLVLENDINLEKDVNKSLSHYFALYQKNAKWGRIS